MNETIPTYQLNVLTEQEQDRSAVFFLDRKVEAPVARIDIPYRRNFYAVGICIRGSAELNVNLETYAIVPDCLVVKPPHTINQWSFMSDDFETLTIFFTKEFITTNTVNPDALSFFESGARHVFPLSAIQSEDIISSLNFIRQKYKTAPDYRHEILKNLINSLLYEIAAIYSHQRTVLSATQTRSQLLAAEFKQLVNTHFSAERGLAFYADKLFITPKHLTETVREVTGKTAGEWIVEAVILEAKVLLQAPSFTIAQISDRLHFTDQSTFGKFFKNQTGLSPAAYRQTV